MEFNFTQKLIIRKMAYKSLKILFTIFVVVEAIGKWILLPKTLIFSIEIWYGTISEYTLDSLTRLAIN